MTENQNILFSHQQNYLRQWVQFVLLDEGGNILESNNSFADLSHLYGQSIYQFNPFLESLQSIIETLDDTHSELFFPRMEIPFWDKQGVFDYTIRRVLSNNQIYYLWTIEDNTAHNQYLSIVQQERNDTYIQNELLLLKTQNQILKEEVEKQTADIQAQKALIEKQKEDILDSIRYAQRIQNAILPTHKTLRNVGFGTMIFYSPKDIVSGDFYWAVHLGNKSIIIVADCTGHGVPGAFMSIVGQNMLQSAIIANHITNPKQLLESLDAQMLQIFDNDNRVHDGMDIAILTIDNEENSITFAGAKRPLYLIRENYLQEIKGAPYAIGGHHLIHGKSFVEFTLKIQANDMFYIFSDGYADQFGGQDDKKFMLKNFKNLLLKIHHLPLELQKDILNENLLSWKGEHKQTDDILIAGLKF
jgi:serine phosphatase RsbU (regulator of sigma subunit)